MQPNVLGWATRAEKCFVIRTSSDLWVRLHKRMTVSKSVLLKYVCCNIAVVSSGSSSGRKDTGEAHGKVPVHAASHLALLCPQDQVILMAQHLTTHLDCRCL